MNDNDIEESVGQTTGELELVGEHRVRIPAILPRVVEEGKSISR